MNEFIDIFNAWVQDGNLDIEVRFCKIALLNFMGSDSLTYGISK